MENKCIYIFSPSASEDRGHPLYVQNLIKHLSVNLKIVLYTLKNSHLNELLIKNGANLIINEKYPSDGMAKDNFRKFGKFGKLIYGFRRIGYSYSLLKDFYRQTPKDTAVYHLLEFEYFAACMFFFLNPNKLKRTILGFHAADFHWIKGRSFIINVYKYTLSFILPSLIKKSLFVTSMGVTLREQFAKSLHVESYQNKIIFTGYGNDIQFNDLDKISARMKLGLPQGSNIGLFFGAIRKDKGILDLLNSFKEIDQRCILLIAGSLWDISENTLTDIINKENIDNRVIRHLGYMSEEDIKFYFSACDFVFITHRNTFFSFSGPLSLSVEHRRPVIASNIAEIGYFVKKFNLGLLFNPQDWKGEIPKINEFVDDLINGMDDFNFDDAMSYNSWKSVSDRNIEMYDKVLNLKAGKQGSI